MRIFETRHGQVAAKDYYKNNPSLPIGDVALSPLGKEQARILGKRLKELNFKGVIFSSPYDRTMKTASIIAEELGCGITPLACLHEIVYNVDNTCRATAEEIMRNYPLAKVEEDFPKVWWGDKVEKLADVIERVKTGLEPVLKKLPKESDVLLVGHGATSVALRHLFGVTENNLGFHWNCHLSLLYSSSGESYANDCSYFSEEMKTSNFLRYVNLKEKIKKSMDKVYAFLNENEGKKVLHIGDTNSAKFGYYKMLIEQIKPDVIIHTGDMADELKAGRIESVRYYWKNCAQIILKMMEQSGARVIIVSGNNDLEEEVKEYATTAEIVPRNTILDLYGKKVLLCHEIACMDEDTQAEVYLYGHGLTGETRTPEDNERNGKRFYNASWGASLHVFEKNKSMVILDTSKL